MLLQKERRPGDRSNPSLSQVRTETFRGSRSHYRDWKRIIEAQRNLHKLAMLIYVRCQGEPRQILNQLKVNEMQEPGGLGRVMRLQDAFGAWPTGGHPARALQHISTLKRLCGEYLREEDKETTISDKSFAQRLLSRAALTRRERMDIFFSSWQAQQRQDRAGDAVPMQQLAHGGEEGEGPRPHPSQEAPAPPR